MADHEDWQTITLEELEAEMLDAVSRMDLQQRRLWEVIRINPEKWQQDPYGNEGGGFWVVGLVGSTAVWYNDIECGFNLSSYSSHGIIDEYWCNDDELEWAVQRLLILIMTGQSSGSFGPPVPLKLSSPETP